LKRKSGSKVRKSRIKKIFFSRNKFDNLIDKLKEMAFSSNDYDETVDYVVDQICDRLFDVGIKAQIDYDNGLIIYSSPEDAKRIKEIIHEALQEKIADVEWEKRHGERD